jgi:hypothetical protein
MSSYTSNNVPMIAGAYLVNADSNSDNILVVLPLFTSISDLDKMKFANVNNFIWVLPGYKLEAYDSSNYANLRFTFDNTTGTKILYRNSTPVDTARSIKLYYNNNLLNEQYVYQLINTS